jgi:hypothetical protein
MTSEEARQALMIRTEYERMRRDLIDALGELPVLAATGSRRLQKSTEAKLRRTLTKLNTMAGAGTLELPREDVDVKPAPAPPKEAA